MLPDVVVFHSAYEAVTNFKGLFQKPLELAVRRELLELGDVLRDTFVGVLFSRIKSISLGYYDRRRFIVVLRQLTQGREILILRCVRSH